MGRVSCKPLRKTPSVSHSAAEVFGSPAGRRQGQGVEIGLAETSEIRMFDLIESRQGQGVPFFFSCQTGPRRGGFKSPCNPARQTAAASTERECLSPLELVLHQVG